MRRVLSLALLVLLLDQASKWIILQWVMQPPRVIEVTSFFNLVLVYNRGVSFGLLASDLWWKPFALAALALLIVGCVLWWVRRQTAALPLYGSGLIVGGAVGNMIDRFLHPGVVDFLDFHLAGWHWPAFNVADAAIVCGVGLLLLDGLFGVEPEGKDSRS